MLTLTTYADYILEQETENPLPEPVAAPPNTNERGSGQPSRSQQHLGYR